MPHKRPRTKAAKTKRLRLQKERRLKRKGVVIGPLGMVNPRKKKKEAGAASS